MPPYSARSLGSDLGDFAQAVAPPLIAGASSAYGQAQANAANERIALDNRRFQERMSNTSWQRGVEDMRLAGINPALSYMKGGASSPGGSTATVQSVLGQGVNSAMSAMRLKKELEVMDVQKLKMHQEGFAAMSRGAVDQTVIKQRKYGASKSRPSFFTESAKVRLAIEKMQLKMLMVGMPAAEVTGSKAAALSKLIFGSGGPAGTALRMKRR